MLRLRSVLVLAAALSACGPSRAEVRAANHSVYQTEFANVWNAVVSVVKEQYPRAVIEDPGTGELVTDWHLIERVDLDDAQIRNTTVTSTTPQGQTGLNGNQALPNIGGRFLRIYVKIKPGGPPWRVEVDGEAALYVPGMALITPYKHGAADEPTWVQPRLDKIRVGIYRALKAHARLVKVEPKKQADRDDSAWKNLPGEAVKVISDVHLAADKKDTARLKPFMRDDFVWSLASNPGVDGALAFWNADPTILGKLRDTLASGCDLRDGGADVVCPVTGDQPGRWRAEFKKDGASWKFASFYLNE
jgi:hypothetical protein